MLLPPILMDLVSPATATLGIWTIARLAALLVLATEALFLFAHRREPAPEGRAAARFFWALTPALLLSGLCFWCTVSVNARRSPSALPAVAQLAR